MTDPLNLATAAMNNEIPVPDAPSLTVDAPITPTATSKKAPFFTKEKIKVVAQSRWFRYMLLFVVISILLLVISPPFVQQRRKNQSSLEKAPTSYKRVLIAAAVTTGIVVISPMIITHKDKFLAVAGKIKNIF
jgi:hypothetical protein